MFERFARLLCVNSAADVDWLVEKFNLDLSLVARLGGHSQPRTHRGKERFPGMTITYALIQMLEKAVFGFYRLPSRDVLLWRGIPCCSGDAV